MAFDDLEPSLEKLIWTVARVGSFICLALHHDFPPSWFVPGEEPADGAGAGAEQSDDEQIAILTALSAR